MKINHLRPVLWTEKIEETLEFYTNVLGFITENVNLEWGWASLSKDGAGIMLSKPNGHFQNSKIFFSGSFYFNVDDVDALWEKLKQNCEVCYEPENFEWNMRAFAIFDNNGYILQFGQNI